MRAYVRTYVRSFVRACFSHPGIRPSVSFFFSLRTRFRALAFFPFRLIVIDCFRPRACVHACTRFSENFTWKLSQKLVLFRAARRTLSACVYVYMLYLISSRLNTFFLPFLVDSRNALWPDNQPDNNAICYYAHAQEASGVTGISSAP